MDLSVPKFHDLLIGTNLINETVEFIGTDSEKSYNQNLNKQPSDWYYKKNKIFYSHNEFGHRCNSINTLDFNNYFLFSGCSHTYGVGLELEKTYSYLLSDIFKKDYYNLSFGGAGPDYVFYNVLLWLDKFPAPKHIFVQIPNLTKFMTQRHTDGSYNSHTTFEGSWSHNSEVTKFAVIGGEINYWSCKTYLYFNLLKQKCLKYQIPYTLLYFNNVKHPLKLQEKIYCADFRLDVARDLSHFGNISNKKIATDLQKTLQL